MEDTNEVEGVDIPSRKICWQAKVSLVCGVLSFVLFLLSGMITQILPRLKITMPGYDSLVGFIFITGLLCPLISVIFGILGLIDIRKKKSEFKGVGFCITGIILSAVFVTFFIIRPLFIVRPIAYRMMCGSHMDSIRFAINQYCKDHDGKLPEKEHWCDELMQYDLPTEIFLCPHGRKTVKCSYSMNESLSGKVLEEIDPNVVLVFESNGGWNSFGSAEMLTKENHFGKGCVILFANGDVNFIDDFSVLRWR